MYSNLFFFEKRRREEEVKEEMMRLLDCQIAGLLVCKLRNAIMAPSKIAKNNHHFP